MCPLHTTNHQGAAAKISTEPLKGQVLEWKTKFGRGHPEIARKSLGIQWEDREEKMYGYCIVYIPTHRDMFF